MVHVFFFFQAEDGIRVLTVTGVQTCALPIFFGNYIACFTWTLTWEMRVERGEGRFLGQRGWGRDESKRRRAESQRIVAARPLCRLQYPVAYLSRLQRILPAARWELYFKAAGAARPPRRLGQRHVPLGAGW